MHRRPTALLLVPVLLMVLGLSGCVSAQATAMGLESRAQQEARSWDAGAELVLAFGLEGTKGMVRMLGGSTGMGNWSDGALGAVASIERWERVERDPRPGDGRGELWAYVYRSGDGARQLAILMDREGRTVASAEEDGPGDGLPIGAVEVDSDRAVEVARAANEALAGAIDGHGFLLTLMLFREAADEAPGWLIAGGGLSGPGAGGGFVVVDAVTAEVRMSEGSAGGGAWDMDDWG